MKKRIQQKSIQSQIREQSIKETRNTGFNSQDIITILGGVAGFMVAVLWLAGRSYTAGYFSAMNIPAFQINLSVWEYAESSWQRLIYYFGKQLYLPLLLVASILLSVIVVSAITQRLFPEIKMLDAVRKIDIYGGKLLREYRFIIILSIFAFLFYVLLLALVDINSIGKIVGKEMVIKNSYLVDIYSTSSLPLEQGELIQNTSPALTRYSNLHLLTFNNGKYYLFRELDLATCKPKEVFIVDESQNIYFVIRQITAVSASCEEDADS